MVRCLVYHMLSVKNDIMPTNVSSEVRYKTIAVYA